MRGCPPASTASKFCHRKGLVNAELVRIDPGTGATTVIPWPESPCDEAFRDSLSGRNGKLYVARTCNPISGPPRANDYIVYDPDASSWSTLATGVWDEPAHAELAWDDAAQEGLFTTPSQSCSSVYRLTRDGPAFVDQTVRTPLGDVDTRAGLTMQPDVADCLRDGRILGAPVNRQDQVALMVSPVKGPPGPDREDEQSVLVIARWSPGSSTPLSAFRTLSDRIDSASPPAWSADDKSVFWSGNGSIMRADVASPAQTRIAREPADQIAPSPDGTRLALRRGILTKDYQSLSEIRIIELPSSR